LAERRCGWADTSASARGDGLSPLVNARYRGAASFASRFGEGEQDCQEDGSDHHSDEYVAEVALSSFRPPAASKIAGEVCRDGESKQHVVVLPDARLASRSQS
jgi:hypothetical protein